jgi:hypothetical protein
MDEQSIDLSVLDPKRNGARFDAQVARIAQRAIENRRLRRAVVRRGVVAFAIAMAAGLVLWFSAPSRPTPPPQSFDILDWATRDIGPTDVLSLGGPHAQ